MVALDVLSDGGGRAEYRVWPRVCSAWPVLTDGTTLRKFVQRLYGYRSRIARGVAVMSTRSNLGFETELLSDSAALYGLVAEMVRAAGSSLRLLRDPTRGGLATTLNEIAQQSGVGFIIEESAIPVRAEVAAACELLGLDPLYVANEGKLVAVVAPDGAETLLTAMRAHPLGRDAALIGEATADEQRFVQMTTSFGGGRIVDWLMGEQLPRIC
jgi:hydrogenase expression/formation protein HypE